MPSQSFHFPESLGLYLARYFSSYPYNDSSFQYWKEIFFKKDVAWIDKYDDNYTFPWFYLDHQKWF